MTIAGELINILGFKLEGEANLKKFNQGMDSAAKASKASADTTTRHAKAAGVAAAGALAIVGAGFKNFAEFERQMGRIGITAGSTVNEVKKATDTVQRLANDFAMPLDQAVAGLDTLVASGLSLEQAMAFLPSVLATAQASGAATEDIANTALKASSALKISAADMQNAFDIMVAGGKAGQFELKDMAKSIPSLSNQFANLGYEGEEGLQKLIAILQTLRTTTGDAGTAATNAGEIFGKMLSPDVVKNFKDLGTDIKEELASAKAAGEDVMKAYVRISEETLKSNPKATLVDLFGDKQMREGMLTLMRMGDAWRDFDKAVSDSGVAGGTMRDLGVVLEDNASKIQRMANSWDQFSKAIGASAAGPIGAILDASSNWLSYDDALNSQLEKEGYDWWGRTGWGLTSSAEEKMQKAREGGYAPTAGDRAVREAAPDAYRVLGRYPQRPNSTVGTRAGSTTSAGVGSQDMINAGFDNLAARIEGINSNLATMTSQGAVQATITDARQDNRQFPVSVSAPVTVNVQQATQAPGAVGNAVSGAIGQAATAQASRIEAEPATP